MSNQPGDIKQWNFQSDPHGGQYKLIEQTAPGEWTIEHLPPSDSTVDSILAHAAESEANGWTGEFNNIDEVEAEIAYRQDAAGTRTTVKFVSAAQFAAHF